jgi:predicted dinucleotide-binding enzyme
MNIAIIGHGNVGSALAIQWVEAAHEVVIGARQPSGQKVRNLVGRHRDLAATTIEDAVQQSEVILIATPADATVEIAHALGDVRGKYIIDATNSVFKKPDPYPHATAALKDICKTHNVVKAFNCTGFENMADPNYGDTAADMFIAGNNPRAKEIARQLAKDAGFGEVYDMGSDDKIPLLEQFAMIWINLAISQGYGRNIAFKVMKRSTPA